MNKIKEEQLSKIQEQQKTLNNILHEVGYLEANMAIAVEFDLEY